MNNEELQQALLQAFSEEAPELLHKAQTALLDMENTEGEQRLETIDRLKRALHSLKGSASAIGRDDLCRLCHHLESYLLSLDHTAMYDSHMDLLHEGVVYIETWLFDEPDDDMLDELIAALSAENTQASETTLAGNKVDEKQIKTVSEDKHQPVSEAAPAPAAESEPADTAGQQSSGQANVGKELVFDETIRVATQKINTIQASVGELIAFDLQQKDNLNHLVSIDSIMADIGRNWLSIRHEARELQQLLPRQKAGKLDAKLSQFSSDIKDLQHDFFVLRSQLSNQNAQFSLLVDEIGLGVKAVRMMPVVPFFESFRTVAREAARKLDKKVNVECIGSDIEADKMVLEKIKDAVLHIVRNCVSHGIESNQERLAQGKPEAGTIRLSAGFNGAYVTLHISDDGKGFDQEKIARKAVQLGFFQEGETLNEEQVLDLISMPGFSTAEQVDQVAGRGVGMDVVASALTEVGGHMTLETEPGKGSCFTLSIPATLANTQGLMVQVGTHRFGIVLDFVERIVRMSLDKLIEVDGKSVLYLNDEPVAVCSLANLLHLSEFEPQNAAMVRPLLIIKSGNQRLALIVDDIPGEIPMMVKSLGPQYAHIDMYAGCTILSEGTVLPVMNVRAIMQQVGRLKALNLEQDAAAIHEDHLSAYQASEAATVLVVDDSITTRTLERNILESEGYRVLVATDGVEAMEMLMSDDDIALLVTDMEMPRMDGIELCRNVRSSRCADLPIIMVTSVGNPEEKEKALQAGSDAYIIKHDFHQDQFLMTVRRFVDG